MKELKKQHLEMLQLLESIEVMLQNGDSIHPNSVIRGAIQKAIGMDINLNKMKKTAVEWLVDEILMPEYGHIPEWVIDKVNEAKEKEEQQTVDFAKRVADHWGMVNVPRESIEKFLKTE